MPVHVEFEFAAVPVSKGRDPVAEADFAAPKEASVHVVGIVVAEGGVEAASSVH